MKRTKFLSESEMNELKALLSRHSTRDSLLLTVAMETGARASEILAISKDDLDDESMTVYLRTLKNGNDREFPLSVTTYRKLRFLCHVTGGRPFPISYRRFCQIWHEWRPCLKKLHALRHSKAVAVYRKTKNIKLVQQLLGHRSLNTTMVYVDFDYSPDETRKLLGT